MRNNLIWKPKLSIVFFLLCALLVWFASFLTISGGVPHLYSPFSFIIIIPALYLSSYPGTQSLASLIAALVGPVLFAAWSFPIMKGQMRIPKRSKILAIVLVVLSIVFLISGWSYGNQYQGAFHTIAIYIFNLAFWVGLFFTERKNTRFPSFISNLVFHTLLFFWLAWVAFPWLGELI
jgi:hypothetical protein